MKIAYPAFTCSKPTTEIPNNLSPLFKLNNKETRATSIRSLLIIFELGQVNVGWVSTTADNKKHFTMTSLNYVVSLKP